MSPVLCIARNLLYLGIRTENHICDADIMAFQYLVAPFCIRLALGVSAAL